MNHQVSVVELSQDLGVSVATIRRDLDSLGAQGRLLRVHGGGEAIESDPDGSFEEISRWNPIPKDAIAKAAAQMVHDGDTILLDIGTTTACLARRLLGKRITVITSSIEAVRILSPDDNIPIMVLGGMLRRSYHSLVGPLTAATLAMVSADISFLSAAGISSRGELLDNTGTEVPVKQAMISAANKVVLLADSTKFPRAGLLKAAGPEQINVLITDSGADTQVLDHFHEAGTEVVLV